MDLREWLFRKEMKAVSFAKLLGINGNYLRSISNGKQMPGKFLADAIERATGNEVKKEELYNYYLKKNEIVDTKK